MIPEEIKSRIPDYFYLAMAGELVSIFGSQILDKLDDDDYSGYDLDSGTAGWGAAFYATCKKLDMEWLLEYVKTLKWYDRDMFDGIIEDTIITRVCEEDGLAKHANCYYKYLINKLDDFERSTNEKSGQT